jgi:hypothetical protein
MPIFDSELFARNGATQISASCEHGTPTYEVSFELDSNGLHNLQNALNGLEHKDEMTEIKSEIIKMHDVHNTPGATLHEKIDNYLETEALEPKIMEERNLNQRYKIKHR